LAALPELLRDDFERAADADLAEAPCADVPLFFALLPPDLEAADALLTGGTVSHMPAFNFEGWTRFALCSAATVTPSFEAIPVRVSPGRTR